MAVRPDYDIGVLNLTSGSSDFTTAGSSLQTAAVQAGDGIITPSGHLLIIASITGQNSGTLFLPCPPAAAGTGLALRIRFQPDGSRYQGAVRNLIDLLSSGNVEALSGLTGEEGKVPVFTGPGAMALQDYIADPNGSLGKLAQVALAANKLINTDNNGDILLSDITPFARTILDDENASEVWSSLGGSFGGKSDANGWIRFPSGLILQWGRLNLAPNGAFNQETIGGITFYSHFYTPSFPIPFPNAIYSVSGSNVGYTFANQGTMALRTVSVGANGFGADASKDNFLVIMCAAGTGNSPYVSWQAWGM